MTEKKVMKKPVATPKATINPDAVAIVAAILMTKGTPMAAAVENAKLVVENCNAIVGK
jgi:hypothetical protein